MRYWSQALAKILTMLLTALSVLTDSVLPNPVGSTAKSSFPLTKAAITSLCFSFRINPRRLSTSIISAMFIDDNDVTSLPVDVTSFATKILQQNKFCVRSYPDPPAREGQGTP